MNNGFLLLAPPALFPPLSLYGVGDPLEMLGPHKLDGAAGKGLAERKEGSCNSR